MSYKLTLEEETSLADDLIKFIEHLENESFEGWSIDAINGYLTATSTVKEKIRELDINK